MPTQNLKIAFAPEIDSHTTTLVKNAISELATELESYNSDWSFYSSSYNYPDEYSKSDDENDFVTDVLSWADANWLGSDGDAWIAVHTNETWGFGGGREISGDGQDGIQSHMIGNAVLGRTDNLYNDTLMRSIAKHEMAHGLGACHEHGEYELNSSDKMKDISPMASSYVHTNGNGLERCDTDTGSFGCGTGHTPDCFENDSEDNYEYAFFQDTNRWSNGITYETKYEVFNHNSNWEDSLLADYKANRDGDCY